MLSDKYINCLLYADDLVSFSRSAKSLQIILNKLESFCENADLSVNLDKTKIMIFNNCDKSLNNYLFRYGADELENIKSYKYVGLIMSPFGNFNLARRELKKVALKTKIIPVFHSTCRSRDMFFFTGHAYNMPVTSCHLASDGFASEFAQGLSFTSVNNLGNASSGW